MLTLALLPGAAKRPAPRFVVDASWPRPLPNKWRLGQVGGIVTDARDRVWVLHRPGSVDAGHVSAPPLVVFSPRGDVVASWGGAGRGTTWPTQEHSIAIDARDGGVWVGGNGRHDGFIVKYTAKGRFLLRIGSPGPSLGSADTTRLGRPAGLDVDEAANEIYVADGYDNHRVIVFDATNGTYKRHCGAYGLPPTDTKLPAYDPAAPPARQFAHPHGVRVASYGLVYVSDRSQNRIQIFRRDGGFVAEHRYRPETRGGGRAWDVALWPAPVGPHSGETHLLAADGENNEVRVIDRAGGQLVAAFGRAGSGAGQFRGVHTLAVDRRGHIYAGEVGTGKRIQRFVTARSSAAEEMTIQAVGSTLPKALPTLPSRPVEPGDVADPDGHWSVRELNSSRPQLIIGMTEPLPAALPNWRSKPVMVPALDWRKYRCVMRA